MGKKASIIWRERIEACNWIKRNTSKNVVLTSKHPDLVNLYTGRKTLWTPDSINNILKFDYLILMPPQATDISGKKFWESRGLQIFKREPQRFKQVFKTSRVSIWEVCKFPVETDLEFPAEKLIYP